MTFLELNHVSNFWAASKKPIRLAKGQVLGHLLATGKRGLFKSTGKPEPVRMDYFKVLASPSFHCAGICMLVLTYEIISYGVKRMCVFWNVCLALGIR